jgi:hypothetical protein
MPEPTTPPLKLLGVPGTPQREALELLAEELL